jgi:hypothetical protein
MQNIHQPNLKSTGWAVLPFVLKSDLASPKTFQTPLAAFSARFSLVYAKNKIPTGQHRVRQQRFSWIYVLIVFKTSPPDVVR